MEMSKKQFKILYFLNFIKNQSNEESNGLLFMGNLKTNDTLTDARQFLIIFFYNLVTMKSIKVQNKIKNLVIIAVFEALK